MRAQEAGTRREAGAVERAALALLWLFTAASVAGFAVFGLNPALVARLPGAAAVYPVAFAVFPVAQVWLGFAVLALALWRWVGVRWLGAFAAIYVLSLAAELAGTTFGLPFGAYEYRSALGAQWLGRVPVVIPLSWFYMAVPAYALSARACPASVAARVGLAALLLTAWDLSLDPAMSHLTLYWSWSEAGGFYGMPWINLGGWLLTGLVLMTALELLRARRWTAVLPAGWLAAYYGAHLFLSLGMVAAGGLWGAVAVSALVYAPLVVALRREPGLGAAPVPASALRRGVVAEEAS